MGAIKDIQNLVEYRKLHGQGNITVLGISTDKFNTLYIDYLENGFGQISDINVIEFEDRLKIINGFMQMMSLPEIAILE